MSPVFPLSPGLVLLAAGYPWPPSPPLNPSRCPPAPPDAGAVGETGSRPSSPLLVSCDTSRALLPPPPPPPLAIRRVDCIVEIDGANSTITPPDPAPPPPIRASLPLPPAPDTSIFPEIEIAPAETRYTAPPPAPPSLALPPPPGWPAQPPCSRVGAPTCPLAAWPPGTDPLVTPFPRPPPPPGNMKPPPAPPPPGGPMPGTLPNGLQSAEDAAPAPTAPAW